MAHLIDDLKAHARILLRRACAQDPAALKRVRLLDELRTLDEAALAASLKRRHCLAVVGRELGFAGWLHAVAVLSGAASDDFGTLLYPDGADVHWNIWCASHEEASKIRAQHGGYLLAYRRQFFIVDRHFIETLGLDPDDADWELIGRDWARPTQPEARERLYAKLIRQRVSLT